MDSAAVFALDTSSGKVQRRASMKHARFDVALAAAPNNYTNGVLYAVGGGIHNTTKDGHQVPDFFHSRFTRLRCKASTGSAASSMTISSFFHKAQIPSQPSVLPPSPFSIPVTQRSHCCLHFVSMFREKG